MKILLASLLIITASMNIGSKLNVNLKIGTLGSSYSLPFENGYVLNKHGKIMLLLKFHKKNDWQKKDTDERVHLYISGEEVAFNNVELLSKIEAFFIRVQVRPDYGHLIVKDLQLMQNDDKTSHLSGFLICEKMLPTRDLERSITLNIANLPLAKVSSFDEMNDQDRDYFKKIVRKEFNADWYSN